MASCNLRCILLTALLFFGVIAIVCAKPVETGWRCGAGQSQTQPAKLTPLPETMNPETLRSWDVFAVNAIARGIRGEAALADVSPLFETLLTQGLFAGAYAEIPETMSDLTDLSLRSAGFLDAARRFDNYWNTGLLREILSDEKLVAALRSDTTSQADAGAVEFVTRHLKEPSQISALLPLVLELRNCLSVVDDLSAVAREFEAGKPGLATIQLLAVTYLWDVRLYLQTVMNDELLISALHQSDEKLLADFRSNGSANLLRWFLFGGYEAQAKAALWDAFEAPRFIALYQDNTWVGHAAALANELVLGTVLSVTAEPVAVVGIMGETAPYVVSVRPAKGASYATPALVWPRTAQQTYEGFRCLQETRVEFTPAPVTGEPASSGLRFVLAYNKPGEYRLSFQYKLYGIELSTVELKPIVLLHNQSGSDAMAVNPEPVERPLQLEKLPANYRFTMQSDHQAIRKITLLSDGEHAFEYIIRWEVQHHGTQPATGVSFGSLQSSVDAVAQIMPQVKAAAVEDFRLLQELPQGPGAVTWLGRVGDGWYLLLQGTQRLLRRGDMTTPGSIWAPVQITDEMIAATEENDVLVNNMTELAEMLVKELSDRMTPPAVNQSVETRAYLMVVAHTLDEAEKLRAQTLDQVMAWREHRSTSEESARFIGEKINPPALELLRHFEIAPPEGMLQGLHNSMQTTLGCLCAGVALCERALWLNDPVRLQKGETLLADAERTGAKTRLKLDILHPGGS